MFLNLLLLPIFLTKDSATTRATHVMMMPTSCLAVRTQSLSALRNDVGKLVVAEIFLQTSTKIRLRKLSLLQRIENLKALALLKFALGEDGTINTHCFAQSIVHNLLLHT